MAWTTTGGILSTYDTVLKDFYLPAIQDQLNHGNILSDVLDVNEEDVSGRKALIDIHYQRNSGVGARSDVEALPDAGAQKHIQATVPMHYIYGRISVTGPTIAATRDERGAYARALDIEILGVVRDLQKEVNRMYWGCGYGVVGRWNATTSGTVYVAQKAYTGSGGCSGTQNLGAFGSTFGAKYLKNGFSMGSALVLSGMSSAATREATLDASDIAVSAITEGTYTDSITVTDPSVTEAAGTLWLRPLAAFTPFASYDWSTTYLSAARKEPMGLRGIVTDTDLDDIVMDDGTRTASGTTAATKAGGGTNYTDYFQGLTVDTYTWWKANVDSHPSGRYTAQRALTRKLLQKMFDKVELAAGVGYGPDLIITTQAIRREYLELMQDSQSFMNTMKLDGGWEAISYNGVPLTVDPDDAIDGEIYFLTTKDLARYRMSDYDWMQKDGSVLSRISGYDAYEAVLYAYMELGCKRRNSQGVITDIAYEA